jgi:hypothetical protein
MRLNALTSCQENNNEFDTQFLHLNANSKAPCFLVVFERPRGVFEHKMWALFAFPARLNAHLVRLNKSTIKHVLNSKIKLLMTYYMFGFKLLQIEKIPKH